MADHVLIAEHSTHSRAALSAPLAADGFAVSEATDADEALQVLRARHPDVVLLSVHLPGDGLEFIDAVKTDPDLASTAVVLMTDEVAADAVFEAIDRGAFDCLRKPVDPAEAVLRVRAALRMAETQRQAREGHERLAALAATDDLTGLLSRRFLESHLRGLLAASARHERPLAVAMLDLDGFKDVNDTHGHAVGDELLQTVVERMRSRLRQEDLLGRWGGDEFLLVLPDVDLGGAVTAADGVRQTIEETEMSVDGERLPITLSAGVAAWSGESPGDLLELADAALYAAKEAGRNRVCADAVARPA